MIRMERILIIGSGPAAVSAIESIRKRDSSSEILLLSEEPYPPYSRPLISYLLAGKIEEERIFYKGQDFYKRYAVQALLGESAAGVNTEKGIVYSSKGKAFSYDKLLIATGGKPIVPPVPGKELKGIFTFTTIDDTRAIERYLNEEKVEKATIIGGGLIGLKAMEALLEWGVKITLVELADRILGLTLDRKASATLQAILEKRGVRIITQNTAQEIRGREKVEEVVLRDGEILPTDLLIFAIGVAPAVQFLSDSGIKINRGIVVNEKMETNIPNVYSAGDVVELDNLTSGKRQPIAIWPNATLGGMVAGANISGDSRVLKGSFPMNSVEVCGIATISFGLTEPQEGNYEVLMKGEGLNYRKIVLRDNLIVGAVFVGNIERAGIFWGLIKEEVDVSPFKDRLLDEDFGLIYLPKDYRKRKIAEVAGS